jgi:hypothetical protein
LHWFSAMLLWPDFIMVPTLWEASKPLPAALSFWDFYCAAAHLCSEVADD